MNKTIKSGAWEVLFRMISKFEEEQQEKDVQFNQKQDCLRVVLDFIINLENIAGVDDIGKTIEKLADLEQKDRIKTQNQYLDEISSITDKYSVVYVTVPSTDVGKTLAHGLVKGKLAACVNIIPQVTSIYEWKNEINEDSELLLMIKTRTSKVDMLTEYVRSNHPYEICEVISLPIKNGNPPYLKWIGETVPEAD